MYSCPNRPPLPRRVRYSRMCRRGRRERSGPSGTCPQPFGGGCVGISQPGGHSSVGGKKRRRCLRIPSGANLGGCRCRARCFGPCCPSPWSAWGRRWGARKPQTSRRGGGSCLVGLGSPVAAAAASARGLRSRGRYGRGLQCACRRRAVCRRSAARNSRPAVCPARIGCRRHRDSDFLADAAQPAG